MEHKSQALAHKNIFYRRVATAMLYAFTIIAIALFVGAIGYHVLGKISWIDSIYNAAMILSGMGPVNLLDNDAAKIFASGYAILSGMLFIGLIGLVLSPVFHRIMHRLHIEEK